MCAIHTHGLLLCVHVRVSVCLCVSLCAQWCGVHTYVVRFLFLSAHVMGGPPFLCFAQQLSELKKENFGLKLRIYHLEEALRKQMGNDSDDWRLVSLPCMGLCGIHLTGLTTPTSCRAVQIGLKPTPVLCFL